MIYSANVLMMILYPVENRFSTGYYREERVIIAQQEEAENSIDIYALV